MDQLLPLVAGQTPNVSRVIPTLDLEDAELGGLEDVFLTEVEGWLVVPEAGEYTLRLISDDGSELSLDGKLLIDHDGLHGPQPKDARITLSQGEHSLRIRHFETYGGWALKLQWKRPGADSFEIVPSTALACVKGDVKVTAPGFKRVIRPLATTRPGDGEPLQGVHPALQLSTARPDDFRPKVGGLAFLPDGRLLVSTWDPEGAVWIVEDAGSGDPAQMKRTRFAAGLAEPLGLCVVGKRVFVCQKQEITELIDKDGDDAADEYRCVSSEWDVSPNFHEFTFGLIEQAGWLYANLAIAIDPGGKSTDPQVPGRGRVIRVPIDGGKVDLTGTETVGTLFFGTTQQTAGTYSAPGAGGTITSTHFTNQGYLYHVKFDGTVDRRVALQTLYGIAGSYPKVQVAPGGKVWISHYFSQTLLILDWLAN
jgi:hypothetical protein